MRSDKVILVILDGWGLAPAGPGNAVALAKTPNYTAAWNNFPHTELQAAGEAVGLPVGADGNSEVGHLNIGAGRIVLQDILRINQAINNGSFFHNQALLKAIEHVRENNSRLHVMGLVGDGIVHSANEHLIALIKLFHQENLNDVNLHLFTDGRDSPPQASLVTLQRINRELQQTGIGKIATICGRYYAMDRDWHWERTEAVYRLLTEGLGRQAASIDEAVKLAYQNGESDEFIKPTLIVNPKDAIINDNDAAIFFNFRIDRPRQLAKAFVMPDFETKANALIAESESAIAQRQRPDPFSRQVIIKNLCFVTMTQYQKGLQALIAFPEHPLAKPLGELLDFAGIKQLRAAETEKERFISYYFNGFREVPFPTETKLIVPSPAVATYDLQPEMSAFLLADKFLAAMEKDQFRFALINLANPDMVGHTGKIQPGIKAIEAVDECLEGIITFALNNGCTLIITADHGNCEEMVDVGSGEINTSHSANKVPFILVDQRLKNKVSDLRAGILGDIAPTILELLSLSKPIEMSGESLVRGVFDEA